jgi:hypothetical protein
LAKRKGLALRNIGGGIGIGVAFSLGDIDPDSDPDSDPDVVWLRLCRAMQIRENPRLIVFCTLLFFRDPSVIDFFRQGVAMNAQLDRGADQVAVISPQHLGDKARLKMLCGFGKEDALLDHVPANIFQALLEPKRLFSFALTHSPLLL